MAPITGNEAKLAIIKASTWGTAVAAGAGDLTRVNNYSPTESVTTLEGNQLGAGLGMKTTSERGNVTDDATVDMVLGYENKGDVILASFLGDPQAPVEQTLGEGDYLHKIFASTNLHDNGFLTIVEKVTTTETIEIPTAAVSSISISHEEPTSEVVLSASMLGSGKDLASATNPVATIDASTLSNNIKVLLKRESYWLINSQSSGALSTGTDLICPLSATIDLERPMIIRNKPCNTSASPIPGSDGFLQGTLSLTLENLEDLDFYTGALNETFYKALLHVEGAQIGAGVTRKFTIYFPSLKLLNSPERSLSEAGDNPVTLSFEILAASVTPTGMDSERPYVEFINTRSTVY